MTTPQTPQTCVHPRKIEDIKEELLILETKTYAFSIVSNDTEYICYCTKCKHIIDFYFFPTNSYAIETYLNEESERNIRTRFKKEIAEAESYTSIW
jgi:hypothetical protein